MRLTLDPWRAQLVRRMPQRFPYIWVEAALIVVLAIQCARLIWTAFAPLGPVGEWKGPATNLSGGTMLTSSDPFFQMSAPSGPAVVTSLPLKLYGVRVDQATGRGSAIIATADGVQQSFVIGDEVMPGIRLKSVARDNVTIDRNGSSEQLFLDQSVPVAVAQPSVPMGPGSQPAAPIAPQDAPQMGAGSRGMGRPPASPAPAQSPAPTPPSSGPSTPTKSPARTSFAPHMEKEVVTRFIGVQKGNSESLGTAIVFRGIV